MIVSLAIQYEQRHCLPQCIRGPENDPVAAVSVPSRTSTKKPDPCVVVVDVVVDVDFDVVAAATLLFRLFSAPREPTPFSWHPSCWFPGFRIRRLPPPIDRSAPWSGRPDCWRIARTILGIRRWPCGTNPRRSCNKSPIRHSRCPSLPGRSCTSKQFLPVSKNRWRLARTPRILRRKALRNPNTRFRVTPRTTT